MTNRARTAAAITLITCATAPAAAQGASVSRIDRPAATAASGSTVVVRGAVRNPARRAATVSVKLSLRATGRVATLGTIRVRNVRARGSRSFTARLAVPGRAPAGAYRVRGCIRTPRGGFVGCRSSRLVIVVTRPASPPAPLPLPTPLPAPAPPPAPAPIPPAPPLPAPDRLRDAITSAGMSAHLAALQEIADLNDGSRSAGQPGYDASADYVAERLQVAGYTVTREAVEVPYFEEVSAPILTQIAPDATAYAPRTARFSGSGDVTGVAQAVDLVVPPPPTPSSTSGCEAADFAGFTPGRVALLQRGSCTQQVKAQNAQAAGASAVVIFNEGQPGREGDWDTSLIAPGITIPVVTVSFSAGTDLAGPPGTTVRVKTDTISELRSADNVIAETAGSTEDMVVLGASLGSAPGSPGINANGTGPAALLEIAERLSDLGETPDRRVRFGFWVSSGEERLGSSAHLLGLSQPQLDAIGAYVKLDRLGSLNGVRRLTAIDGLTPLNPLFPTHFAAASQEVDEVPVSLADDSAAIGLDLPYAALTSGGAQAKTAGEADRFGGTTGAPLDPCVGLPCDTVSNVSTSLLAQNATAAAWVLGRAIFD